MSKPQKSNRSFSSVLNGRTTRVALAGAVLSALASIANAQSASFTNITGGLWSNAANWSGGPADGANNLATFSLNITTAATVNLDSARTIGGLFFHDATAANNQNWTLANNGSSANVLTLDNGASKPQITVRSSLNALSTGRIATISANLAGTNGFIKSSNASNGTGVLVLSGDNSGLTGGITIEQGTIRVASANALGSNEVLIQATGTANGTNFQRIDIASGLTISNNITLNNYSGNAQGSIQATDNTASSTATLTGTITANGFAGSGGSFQGPGTGAAAGSGLLVIAGPVNGTGQVNVRGGSVRFNGPAGSATNHAFTGYVSLGANDALNTGAALDVALNGASTFDLRGFSQTIFRLSRSSANSATVTNSDSGNQSILTLDTFVGSGYAGLVSGNLGITIRDSLNFGGGSLTLTNASNSFTGPVVIGAGRLAASSLRSGGTNSALGAASAAASNIVFDGGAFDFTSATSSVTDRAFTINNGRTAEISVTNGAASLTMAGAPDASDGGLTKAGPGTLVLSGNQLYSGATAVLAGQLFINGSHNGAGAYSVNGGLGGIGNILGAVTLNSGASLIPGTGSGTLTTVGTLTTGNLDLTDSTTLTFDLTSDAAVGGTTNDLVVVNGNFTVSGSNTLQVNLVSGVLSTGEYGLVRYTGSGPVDASGFTLTGVPVAGRQAFGLTLGTIGADNYLKLAVTGAPANLTWNGGNGNTDWDTDLTFNWQGTAPLDEKFLSPDNVIFNDTSVNKTVTVQGSIVAGQILVDTASTYLLTNGASGSVGGLGTLTKQGVGTLVLAVSTTYAGTTTISGGTIQVGDGGTEGTLGTGSVVNNGTLSFNRTDNINFNNPVSGTGGILYATGGVTIGGNSSYDGPTTVAATATVFPQTATAFGSTNGATTVVSGGQIYLVPTSAVTINESFSVAGSGPGGAGVLRAGAARTTTFSQPLILTAAATLNVDAGATLLLGNTTNSVTGANTDLTLNGPGVTQINSSPAIGTGIITNDSTLAVLSGPGSAISIPNVINGTGVVRVIGNSAAGTGSVTLGGSNSYAGGSVLLEATVIPTNDSAFGTGTITIGSISSGGTNTSSISLPGGITLANTLILPARNLSGANLPHIFNTAGTNTLAGAVTAQSGGNQYNIQSDAGLLIMPTGFTIAFGTTASDRFLKLSGAGDGLISGPLSNGTQLLNVVKNGAGTWTFSGALTYTRGTTVNAGHLLLQSPLRPVTGSLVVTGPGALTTFDPAPGTLGDPVTVAGEFSSISVAADADVVVTSSNRALAPHKLVIAGTITGPGTIDLVNNDLLLRSTTLASARDAVSNWYNGAGGVLAASAAGGPGDNAYATLAVFQNDTGDGVPYFSTFDGVAVTATDILVKYTFFGDTNLDGTVTGSDLANVVEGLSNGFTGWQWGDVNYDGVVNGTDFALVLGALNNQVGSFGNSVGQGASGGQVPEPTAFCMCLAILPALGRRRR